MVSGYMTKSISLEDRDEAFIEGQLASGRYSDVSHVVRDALRLLEEHERHRAALNVALDEGLADLAAGRVTPLEDVAARLSERYEAMAKERGM